MRHSPNYNFRLPERLPERNDSADIDDLTFDIESIDNVLKAQDTEDKRLERDKAKVADMNAHKVASVLDHPDDSVTDAKLGRRTVLTTGGTLQTLLTYIGNAIKAATGAATWNGAPATTLANAKAHIDSKANPHAVTKVQVGLGSADNTADVNKPVSTPQQTALNNKVDKVTGKGLSTEDYTTAEKTNLASNTANRHSHGNKALLDTYAQTEVNLKDAVAKRHSHANASVLNGITAALITAWNNAVAHVADTVKHITAAERTSWNTVANKVDKVTGKGLSTEDYTTAEKTKLAGIATGANKYTLPLVQTTGVSTTKVMSQKAVTDALGAAGTGDMLKSVYDTNNNGIVDNAEKVNGLTVLTAVPAGAKFTDTTYGIVTTAVNGLMPATDKTKLNGIAAGANKFIHPSTHPASMITGLPATLPADGGRADTADTANSAPWSGITGKPSTYPPATHSHTPASIGAATTKTYTATISTSWSGSGPWTQNVAVSGMLAADNPTVDLVLSGTEATDRARLEAWGMVSRITTYANGITIRCLDGKPEVAIPIQIKVVR